MYLQLGLMITFISVSTFSLNCVSNTQNPIDNDAEAIIEKFSESRTWRLYISHGQCSYFNIRECGMDLYHWICKIRHVTVFNLTFTVNHSDGYGKPFLEIPIHAIPV